MKDKDFRGFVVVTKREEGVGPCRGLFHVLVLRSSFMLTRLICEAFMTAPSPQHTYGVRACHMVSWCFPALLLKGEESRVEPPLPSFDIGLLRGIGDGVLCSGL